MLGHLTEGPAAAAAMDTEEDDIVDIRDDAPSTESDAAGECPDWVGVAEAANRAGVTTSTVRQWYRSGRLATQRRDGASGGFLVPLADVVRLASEADAARDVAQDSLIDINARYWASETEAARAAEAAARADADDARADARRLAADLSDALDQIEAAREQLRHARADVAEAERAAAAAEDELTLLRTQLEEANHDLRDARARATTLEAQLQATERAATFGSVTSTAWVDEVDAGYRGPFRPQDAFGPGTAGPDTGDAPALAMPDVPQYDAAMDDRSAGGAAGSDPAVDGSDPLEILAMGLPPVVYAQSPDDLLPEPEDRAKGRPRR